MKIKFLAYFTIALFVSSCEDGQYEMHELNSFLKANYDFNYRIYNQRKDQYYTFISEDSNNRYPMLDELDSDYKMLISKIDLAISDSITDIKPIILDYDNLSRKLVEFMNNSNDYLLPEIKLLEEARNVSNEFRLNVIKNRLAIQMVYAYEFRYEPHLEIPSSIELKSNIVKGNGGGIKLTLSNKIVQKHGNSGRIIITKFRLNGNNKKANYKTNKNYSFADVIFDSLENGNYTLDGVLRFYERDGEFEVPFSKNFVVE